jgi:hypothetical protein
VCDVLAIACDEVIQAYDFMPGRKQAVTQMGAEKACGSGD